MNDEIMWLEKKINRTNKADVTVKLVAADVKHKFRTVFTLRNEVDHKITHTGFVKIGVTPTRIYFDEAVNGGFKCSGKGNKRVQMTHVLTNWDGDYTLHLDALKRMWYIEKEERA